tara:strand:+ start:25050 stop:25880 length:831 start_codon:yes stop_codon:yes gene_type:complete
MKKRITRFRPQIRSRHGTHDVLRPKGAMPLFPIRTLIRFGSTTDLSNPGRYPIQINSVDAIKNSSNKLLMKRCFKAGNVRTAVWYTYRNGRLYDEINERTVETNDLVFPIIAKRHFGSRGQGNTKLNSLEDFNSYIAKGSLNNTLFEKFYNYAREYRLHVTAEGCFYTCRKMMKRDTPEDNKWYKNDNNCVWILEERPDFDKPYNWNEVVKESVKALNSVGLDFGAIDLRIQSNKDQKNPAFIVVEINSAPSFGAKTGEKYKVMLTKMLHKKVKRL